MDVVEIIEFPRLNTSAPRRVKMLHHEDARFYLRLLRGEGQFETYQSI